MAKRIQSRRVGEVVSSDDVKEMTAAEMEQVKMKDIDKDGKLAIVPKDIMVEKLGRSPDDWDSIMMRYYLEIVPKMSFF